NRENALLADAAERASVAAAWLGGPAYPSDRLREAWTRVLWHHFHDDVTGTSIPQAYQFSWNDEIVSLNQFAGVLTNAATSVSGLLDTRATGVPLVVYNPLSTGRTDPVEATVEFAGAAPAAMTVVDTSDGSMSPVQVLEQQGTHARILFLANVPSVGFKVFEVRAGSPSSAVPPRTASVT